MRNVLKDLEYSRTKLAVSLVGQLTVVCCRLLTGHIGACCVGIIVSCLSTLECS